MIGMNGIGMLVSIYLMKYSTDVLLIAPAAIGMILGLGRVWDAISDPMAGHLSDVSKARRGRRRAWIYASALPILASTVMLWAPPTFVTAATLVLWMAFAYLLYETASTCFWVPHAALGMELTPDYHDRTRLFAYKYILTAVGLACGLGGVFLVRTAGEPRAMALTVSLSGGVLVAGMILYAAMRVPERPEFQGRGARRVGHAVRDVFRNPHGRLLALVYGLETFGTASIGTLAPYVMEYVVDAPGLTEVFIGMYVVPALAFVPIWVKLSRRVGKKRLWIAAMMATTVAYAMMFFIGSESYTILFVIVVLLGAGSGCGQVIAPSVQADVIDYDEYLTGERKEGAYVAIWNLLRKAPAGITAMITGFVLQAVGFVPNVEQSEETKTALLALIGLLPATCYALATLLFSRFRLDQAEHDRITRVLEERRGGSA
jgi:GPH family glycoside/pentoside/hexuronide:cation symporter